VEMHFTIRSSSMERKVISVMRTEIHLFIEVVASVEI
jgi:hypothetical protein